MAAVVIFGAGAIGGFIGARLALAGHRVRLVGRPAWLDAIAARGLQLRVPGEHGATVRTGLSTHPTLAAALDAGADLVVVAVKSYDTAAAVAALAAWSGPPPAVLTVQNGVGNEEALAGELGAERVLAGAITFPVSVPAPGTVLLERARGGLGLASVDPARAALAAEWAAPCAQAELRPRRYRDYRALKWSKLLMNQIGNALPAILARPVAAVVADPALFALEVAALRETLAVMRARGIAVVALPGYNLPLLALALRVAPLALLRRVLAPLIASSRGSKPPSLQLDLERGRSEVAWLNGAVAQAGREAGVATPVNRALAETLAGLIAPGGPPPGDAWRAPLLASRLADA
jgi:2-dehydropantoate 2-reductase